MKATGIIRRIDELGRIVIPKEIRRTFKIREGTPLEIFCGDNGELVLRKYSMLAEIADFAGDISKAIANCLNLPCLITDKDKVIAVSGISKNTYMEKILSEITLRQIEARNLVIRNMQDKDLMFSLFEKEENSFTSFAIMPIIQNGDTYGSVIIFSKGEKKITESDAKVLQVMSNFLAEQLG